MSYLAVFAGPLGREWVDAVESGRDLPEQAVHLLGLVIPTNDVIEYPATLGLALLVQRAIAVGVRHQDGGVQRKRAAEREVQLAHAPRARAVVLPVGGQRADVRSEVGGNKALVTCTANRVPPIAYGRPLRYVAPSSGGRGGGAGRGGTGSRAPDRIRTRRAGTGSPVGVGMTRGRPRRRRLR